MKGLSKVLSVLLILSAGFGVFNSTQSIKDILDCKAYWEEEGKISDENLDKLDDGVSQLKENEQAYVDGTKTYEEGLATLTSGKAQLAAGKQTLAEGKAAIAKGEQDLANLKGLIDGITQLQTGISNYPTTFQTAGLIAQNISTSDATVTCYLMNNALGAGMPTGAEATYSIIDGFYAGSDQLPKATALQFVNDLKTAPTSQEATVAYLTKAGTVQTILNGIANNGPAGLQQSLAAGLATLVSSVISSGNEEMLAGLKAVLGDNYALFADVTTSPMLIDYTVPTAPTPRTTASFYGTNSDGFGFQVINGFCQLRDTALQPKYDAGATTLAEKKVELSAGENLIAANEKKIADGEVELAEGKAKLGEYEDGESQLSDGLNQLLATETYTGLKSIKDRLGSAFNYLKDNGKNLDLAKAATAVKIGREFSADSGAKITKELTTRAVGAGAIIAAAVFALVAGFLGLAKKKGAKALSVLALVAAAVGIIAVKMAGTEMSAIAGSTIAGFSAISGGVVIAVVALVAAIALNTAKNADAE